MIVETIKVDAESSNRTVKDLRKELKNLKDQLLNTQQGTEEYNRVVQQAANIQHELKEQMEEVNATAADFGQRLGNVTKTMTGISGAITAATGALSLFGVENEEAQKKITATMSSLIGITEGLSKIDDGVKAFKRLTLAVNTGSGAMGKFKIALISTGLGALVVVLGSIIANWDKFSEAIGLSSEKMQRLGDIAKGVLNSIVKMTEGIAVGIGKLLKGDFAGMKKAFKDGFSFKKNFDEGVIKAEEARVKKVNEVAKTEAKVYKEVVEEKEEKLDEWIEKFEKQLAKEDAALQKFFDNSEKAFQDAEKKASQERQRLLDDFDNSQLNDKEKLDKKYDELIDAAVQEGGDLIKINEWYEAEMTKITEDEANKRMAIRKAEINNYLSLAGNIGDILGSIGDMMEDGSEQQKGFAIASTTIQTLVGVATALAGAFTSKTGPWDIALAAAQAASIAASGIASIAKIKKVGKDGSGSDVGGSSYTPSMPVVIGNAPELTQTLDGAMTSTMIRDQKVYVTEHDITDTQNKVRVIEQQATY